MLNTRSGTAVIQRPTDMIMDMRSEISASHGEKKIGATILVVDDEPEIVFAVSMRLKSAGYNVIPAVDGIEATRIAMHQRPDLVLLDIGMPCGDGLTIARRLANNVATMLVPVIFLTARTAPEDQDEARALGAFDYITKPFTSERLLGSVERALRGIRPELEDF